MNRFLLIIIAFISVFPLHAQLKLPAYPDSLFSTYYHQRVSLFNALPQSKDDIIFLGNSFTDGGEWSELFNDIKIKNRGISGDITAGVLKRIDEVVKGKPAKVFLMIGTNDLARGITTDSVVKNILLISVYIKQESPATKLFVQSILPVSDVFKKFSGHTSKTDSILKVNNHLSKASETYQYIFINLYPSFCNQQGKLNEKYSNDGLHLTGTGYLLWKHLVFSHVYGVQEKPSLLPLPQQLKWNEGYFPLYNATSIILHDTALFKEAKQLKEIIANKGWQLEIKNKANKGEVVIELQLEKNSSAEISDESYTLQVTENKISIAAKTPHGIFNAIQTLKQLMRDGMMVDACEIRDRPAFSWRGFMIDVGRNYMSMKLLKEQIDVLAMFKLNVFHFHATEDIAWRIAIKQYPQLTAPENMLRNKGMYYSEAEIKELISYCKERYITFVPEIDMPGHSAAFKRAMKTDMQTDSGLMIVKNILKEFCTTYDVPYIHIGADEVKISNKNFVPEVTGFIQSFGKKVIGWEPGGNFTDNTIRHLWMDDLSKIKSDSSVQYIDSRHLYLNHMDPLEAVTTIFNRKICNRENGDVSALGATLCMWHDRAVADESDIMKMNPVYPGMLAFAERSWRGGGLAGWVSNISDGNEKAFTEFENRLLENQHLYFKNKPFAYVKQSGLKWKLYGHYNNSGDLTRSFEPETLSWKEQNEKIYKQVTGGTIVLRHWWAPLIKGAIDEPKENTTWYATTKIWSDESGDKDCWIGFNNLSRSPATDSPPENAWDKKGSAVWVNGKLISLPKWKRSGQKGNSEIPLIDEGYEYRQPTKVFLQKGWNNVLLKTPVGSFKGTDWQNPLKWMFTFIIIFE
ncbi:MAG TPA: family 20 glycosylhydrolase [Chitinophagaceae bacterium]|nr:family 20 glycosylhydrolase [Chitinophagaceae bacterium]